MSEPTIEPSSREVIENKLLAALDDADKVAIVCTKKDLRMLIAALQYTPDGWGPEYKQMRRDLEKLRDAAFNKGS